MPVVRDFTAILSGASIHGTVGKGAFYTYSFTNVVPNHHHGSYTEEALATFRPMTEDEKQAVRTALEMWTSVSGLTFFEVPPGQGDMLFAAYDLALMNPIAAGFAYYPGGLYDYPLASDVFLDDPWAGHMQILLHEIGHALGLKHTFDGGSNVLATDLDNKSSTVMSYTGGGFPGDVLGPLDRDAIQYLYGGAAADGTQVASWSWNADTHALTQTGFETTETILGVGTADTIFARGGDDIVQGRGGADHIDGGVGNDSLSGGPGNDTLLGGDGLDKAYGEQGDDALNGGAGNDTLGGGDGNDLLDGGADDDNLRGDAGTNVLRGGNGNDGLTTDLDTAPFGLADGGAGDDSLVVSIRTMTATNFSVAALAAAGKLLGIERITVFGNAFANVITGGASIDNLYGDLGNDQLLGGGGNDTLQTDDGDDRADGGAGDDTLWGMAGADNLQGGDGKDYLDSGEGNDTVAGGAGNDTVYAGIGVDTVQGGDGNDYLVGGEGNDMAAGGTGDDTIFGGTGVDTVQGGDGNDYLVGDDDNDVLTGEAGRDTLSGMAGNDTLDGGADDDTLRGDAGTNILRGGTGNDVLITDLDAAPFGLADGGAGDDSLAVFIRTTTATNFSVAALAASGKLLGIERISVTGNAFANVLTGSALADNLYGEAGNDQLLGGAGNDGLQTGDGDDRADGDAGDDTLWGMAGADNLQGGDGKDYLDGGEGNDTAAGGTGDDTIYAGIGVDTVQGGDGNDYLVGGEGNDVLTGGAGRDSIWGEAGADRIIYLSAADSTSALQDYLGGFQTGVDKIDLIAVGPVEISWSTGTWWNTGTHYNYVTVIAGAATMSIFVDGDVILGDFLTAGPPPPIVGTGANDTLAGTAGKDVMRGLAGNDILNALAGADQLDGGAGADAMTGGLGDDIYTVDNALDRVIETGVYDSGVDKIVSSVTFRLPANVENLILSGTAAINGTGNGLANAISGNSAANVLNGAGGADTMAGGGGNDSYVVDSAFDQVTETSAAGGVDRVTSSVSFALGGNVENLSLTGSYAIDGTGNGLANTIVGNAAPNTLDGKGGADTMTGGAGSDTYFVENVGDKAIETSATGGIDTVRASVSFTLGGNVENLILLGSAVIDGTGNNGANSLTGNTAGNILRGLNGNDFIEAGAGNDELQGGVGNDRLNGGTGADGFVFNTALNASTNVDHILDFVHAIDEIRLENAVFTTLAAGSLAAGAFRLGSAALDADDRILYEAATGALFYDKDGTGAAAAVQFATLDNMPATLNATDFLVI